MNCHYFISEYIEIFKQHGLIKEMAIKDIDKSCCSSDLNVIDFDYFKEELCKKLGVRTYKSADCLYIDKNKKVLYFIEMKDLDLFVSHNLKNMTIETFMQKTELNHKIEDSYMLLLSAIGCNMLINNTSLISINNKLQLKYIILVKLSSRNFVTLRISNLNTLWNQNFSFLSQSPNIIQEKDLGNFIST